MYLYKFISGVLKHGYSLNKFAKKGFSGAILNKKNNISFTLSGEILSKSQKSLAVL